MAGILNVDNISNSAGTGPVNFPNGFIGSITGNIAANDSNVVFTSSSNTTQICNPTAARTYTMPASLGAGISWVFYNQATSAANYITLQSSGSNAICIVPPLGYVVIIPTSATPTSNTNWILAFRESQLVPFTPTITGGGTISYNSYLTRLIGDKLRMDFFFTVGTVSGVLASVSLPYGLTINTSKTTINNVTGAAGACLGFYENASEPSQTGQMLLNTSTSTSLVYFGGSIGGSTIGFPANGSSIWTSTSSISGYVEIAVLL